jgi:iron complex outermembrane receptor protein
MITLMEDFIYLRSPQSQTTHISNKEKSMRKRYLTLAIATFLYIPLTAIAQETLSDTIQSSSVSTTSNNTKSNATKRVTQLDAIKVTGENQTIGSGEMQYQDAGKAVYTISRETLKKATPSANFTQILSTVPGVSTTNDDQSGLSYGGFNIRGYPSDEVGVTVNGVPINSTSDYGVYATEYGDTENIGDITVEPGFSGVTSAVVGGAGGGVSWVTISPTKEANLDFSQSLGSNGYHRTFMRYNTGDLGPVRSWFSYSDNQTDLWRGAGKADVRKFDAKSVLTISDGNSITASYSSSRIMNNSYSTVTRTDAHKNYHSGYNSTYDPSVPWLYYGMETVPYDAQLYSLDGEFTLSENLTLSVVPYFFKGLGGAGWGSTVSEDWLEIDANMDGAIAGSVPVYNTWISESYRPGLHFKFKHQLGMDHSFEYGALYENARDQNHTNVIQTSIDGTPYDIWGSNRGNYLKFENGNPLMYSNSYTKVITRKAFLAYMWTPNDRWMLNFGGAYNWIVRGGWIWNLPGSGLDGELYAATKRNYKKFTPAAGFKFQFDENNQFYGSIAQTYRAPNVTSIVDWAYNEAYAAKNDTGVSGVAPEAESAWTADIGWRYYGDRLSTVLDLFSSKFKNKQVAGTDPLTTQTVYVSVDKLNISGANIEASFKLNGHLDIYATYSYTASKVKSPLVIANATYDTDGKYLVNTPSQIANLNLNYRNGPTWIGFGLNARSKSWADWINSTSIGGYTTFSMNGGWDFQNTAWLKKPYVKFNIWNLTNHRAFTGAASINNYAASGNEAYSLLQDRAITVTFGASFGI